MNLSVPLAWLVLALAGVGQALAGVGQALAETLEVVSAGEAKLLVPPDSGTANFAQMAEIDERTRKGGASP